MNEKVKCLLRKYDLFIQNYAVFNGNDLFASEIRNSIEKYEFVEESKLFASKKKNSVHRKYELERGR